MNAEPKTPEQTQQSAAQVGDKPVNYLAQEYGCWTKLLESQTASIRRFLDTEARTLADALIQAASQARFSLPERIIKKANDTQEARLPPEQREQLVGGLMDRLTRTGLNAALRQRLDELETSPNAAVVTSAGLLRYATVVTLVHERLPAGRTVRYRAAEGEEIPSMPVDEGQTVGSAITAMTDAIAEDGGDTRDDERGELLVPYVPAARRFFLPQWVAFDEKDRLLVNSTTEAEAHLASMQRFVRILHMAVALAPYMVADQQYQQKRYGMLGQLVNQGRALARFETGAIIATLQRRAAAKDLNRGLSLSLPYFDDQILEMKSHDFDVIPAGRVMFVPAFIVLAAQKELVKVEQDTRLNRSTRIHLLEELQRLGISFENQRE
jgi:hypothetical protein